MAVIFDCTLRDGSYVNNWQFTTKDTSLLCQKLEKAGIISGSQINVDPKSLGYKTLAFIGVFLDKAIRNNEAVKKIEEIPEIIECHYTTGNWSVFIKVLCHDNEHLMELIKTKLQTINGISRTETFISLQQQIIRQIQV